MFNVVQSLESIAKSSAPDRYLDLFNILMNSVETLEGFFDGNDSVMVISDDLQIRKNRLNLLGVLRNQAWVLADFNKIVG